MGIPANFNGFRVFASLLHRRRSREVNQTLHDVWPSPGLVHYIYIFGVLRPIGILPCAKFTLRPSLAFLANVNSRSRSLLSPVRLSSVCLSSVVCNARAPYSGGSNFRQYFYGIRYLGLSLTSTENFTEIVPGEPLRQGNTRGVAKYSDFASVDGYISETVQNRR